MNRLKIYFLVFLFGLVLIGSMALPRLPSLQAVGQSGEETPSVFAYLPYIVRLLSQAANPTNTPLPGGSSTPAATISPPSTPPAAGAPFKIAFIADSESLANWDEVLNFIKSEGAEMVLEQGDYYGDGGTNFAQWKTPIVQILGDYNQFPFLGPVTAKKFEDEHADYFTNVANHLEQNRGASWGGCIKADGQGADGIRMPDCDTDEGGRSGDYWVRWRGVTMAFQNQEPDLNWVPEVFQNDTNIWKLCLWHGNHLDFNVYDKGRAYDGDHSLPYQMYKNCADQGAIIVNGNTHQYTRTCVMENIGDLKNDGPSSQNPNRINREAGTALESHGESCPNAGNPQAGGLVEQVTVGPGRSMVLVSSGAGHDWREYFPTMEWSSQFDQDYYRHDNDGWWATIFTPNRYCRNNCTKADLSGQDHSVDTVPRTRNDYLEGYGVLFITFNYQGDPFKAHGVFKTIPFSDVPGKIIDEFIILYDPT